MSYTYGVWARALILRNSTVLLNGAQDHAVMLKVYFRGYIFSYDLGYVALAPVIGLLEATRGYM